MFASRHETSPTSAVQQQRPGADAAPASAARDALRGASYAEGAAMLAPVQMSPAGGGAPVQRDEAKGAAPAPAAASGDKAATPGGGAQGQEGEKTAADEPGDWLDAIIADRDALVNGARVTHLLLDMEGTTERVGFADAQLEKARRHFCAQLGVADFETSPGAAPAASDQPAEQQGAASTTGDQPGAQQGAASKPAAAPKPKRTMGDSEARDVSFAPRWFNAFQEHCVESGQWTKDQKVIQILVSAYLKGQMGDAPANVLAFFDHVGKSEKNGQAGDLSYGAGATPGAGKTKEQAMKSASMWCQQASTDAYAQAFNRSGYYFLPRTLTALEAANRFGYPLPKANLEGNTPKGQVTIGSKSQSVLAVIVVAKDMPQLAPPNPDDKAGTAQGQIGGAKDCWATKLEPGDMASIVTSKSSVAKEPGQYGGGHAITIIEAAGGGGARPFKYVSGNAGSQTANNGTIRVEEGVWMEPPASFDRDTTRPQNSGEVYIYSITKTSKLQPNVLDDIRKKDPAGLKAYGVTYDAAKDQRVQGG